MCATADIVEHKSITVRVCEDEEKCFDRIPLEEQVGAMKNVGFPDQGYCEFKIEDLYQRTTKITTRKGPTYIDYLCGLPQGQKMSCIVSNIVLRRKHLSWQIPSDGSTKSPVPNPECPSLDSYEFKQIDPADEKRKTKIRVGVRGYCDDNTRDIEATDLNEAIRKTLHYTRMTGLHSLATKIGRKSSKSEIHFYNLTPEDANDHIIDSILRRMIICQRLADALIPVTLQLVRINLERMLPRICL